MSNTNEYQTTELVTASATLCPRRSDGASRGRGMVDALVTSFWFCLIMSSVWFAFGAERVGAANVVLSMNGASNADVPAGSNATLSWETLGVSDCSINNGIGTVSSTGSRMIVAPSSGSTLYTITCSGGQSSSATVSVKPYVDFWITPTQVSPTSAGESASVTVHWNALYATKCTKLTAKNTQTGATRTIFDVAAEPTKGSFSDHITGNTTYTLTCVNAENGQSDTESRAVTFVPFGSPQITSFSTNKGTSAAWDPAWAGVNLRVSFKTTNADTCQRFAFDQHGAAFALSGWSAENLGSGSTNWIQGTFITTVTDDTTFRLKCGRQATDEWTEQELTFDVTGIPEEGATPTNPTATIFATERVSVPLASDLPTKVQVESQSTFTNSCTYRAYDLSNNPISVSGWTNRVSVPQNINAVFDIYLSQTTRLELACTRSSDRTTATANHTITVGMAGQSAPAALELSAAPAGPLNNVQRVRLDWAGQNVSSCSSDDVILNGNRVDNWYKSGIIPTAGVVTLSVYADTSYSLTCLNAVTGERVTDTVFVQLRDGEVEVIEAAPAVNVSDDGGNTSFTTVCPFTPRSGRTIVHFSPTDRTLWLRGTGTANAPVNTRHTIPQSNGTVPVSLAPGTYSVSLHSYDDDSSGIRINQQLGTAQNQRHEEYVLQFVGTSGNVVATTNPTPDLTDSIAQASWYGEVNSALVLNQGVGAVRARISPAAFAFFSPNMQTSDDSSLKVSCAAIDKINPSMPTVDLTITDPSTGPGDDVTLVWDGENVTSCILSGGGVHVPGGADGSTIVTPDVDTTYTVNCTGPNGPAEDSEIATVPPVEPSHVMYLTADPLAVRRGKTTELNWSADPGLTVEMQCAISANTVAITDALSGQGGRITSPALDSETIFTLACTGVGEPPDPSSVRVRVLPNVRES